MQSVWCVLCGVCCVLGVVCWVFLCCPVTACVLEDRDGVDKSHKTKGVLELWRMDGPPAAEH